MVIFKAVLHGLSVVCADIGGIKRYFFEEDVGYRSTAGSGGPASRRPRARRRPQQHALPDGHARIGSMLSADLSSCSFACRHYEISENSWLMSLARRSKERACGGPLD